MFEKEAEEIMMQKVIKENDCIMTPCKTLEDCQLCDFCFDDMVDAFKEGAEFGYNKANEWHYVKDGDLPKGEGAVLIYWKCGDIKCASVVEPYKVTEDTHIIAWKEIVLPELKESK